jgi:uncharacterized protein (DUF433 family)
MLNEKFPHRIVIDLNIMTGKPVIKGTRLTVQHILNLLAQGITAQQIIGEYQGITNEDIIACLAFAAEALENMSFVPSYQGV